MKTAIDKIKSSISLPDYRTYVPDEYGTMYRIGRSYRNLKACLRVASTLSRSHAHVEVKDDTRPMARRLLCIARKGMIIDSTGAVSAQEALA